MADTALAYAAARWRDGMDGRTLLAGFKGDTPLFAIAAGLGGEQDRERFGVLGRYLLRRDGADGYWLLLPADIEQREQLVAEVVSVDGPVRRAAAVIRDAEGVFEGLGDAHSLTIAAPLGDLLDGGQTLAGVMRRELDRLAEALAQPLPKTLL